MAGDHAFGKVVRELGLERGFIFRENRPAGGVRPQDSLKRSANLFAVAARESVREKQSGML